jgi:hypothetical protein
MSNELLKELKQQSDSLNSREKLDLIMHLARRVDHALKPARKWSDIRGALPYPAFGEEAQEWVSRTRREGDERREQALRTEVAMNEN